MNADRAITPPRTQERRCNRTLVVTILALLVSLNQSCSAQTPEQKAVRSLPPEIRRIVETAPYDQVIAFAPNSGAFLQVYALALTWLNARVTLGLESDPLKALDDLTERITKAPISQAEPDRQKLAAMQSELGLMEIRGHRLLVMIQLADLLTWSGQRDKAVIVLRAARDSALKDEKGPSVHLEGLAKAFLVADLIDEAVALANQLGEEAKKAAFLQKLAAQLVDRGDDTRASQIVEKVGAREIADIKARRLVRDGKWEEAWAEIEAIPRGDYYGATGYLREALVKRGKGASALQAARSLLSKSKTPDFMSPPLLRLLIAEGAVDEAIAMAEKIPDRDKDGRIVPYAAAVAHHRKQGRNEKAAELLQKAREIAENAHDANTALCSLAKALREAGEDVESSRIQDEVILRLNKQERTTNFDFVWVVDALIDMEQKEKAASLLQNAVRKLGSSACKSRVEIAYQYARLQRWGDARQTTELCTGSALTAGSDLGEAWRLYGDAFTIFLYARTVSADFRAGFHTFDYNNIFMEVWFKLNKPFFWGD